MLLAKVADIKGRFAQELAALIDDPKTTFVVPPYLQEAIEWVADKVEPAERGAQDQNDNGARTPAASESPSSP